MNCLVANAFGQISFSTLDYNQTSAVLSDGGILFNTFSASDLGYEVPKGSGKGVIYASSLWFGAIDGSGTLRTAVGTYGSNQDFVPGPYSSLNMYSNPSYVGEYLPAMWSVTKAEIENHITNYSTAGYIIPNSISQWPGNGYFALGTAQNLAPFVDLNNDNIYSPQNGDYPSIRGDKATYIIMNDAGGPVTTSTPLGIEVHIMAYQYASSNFIDTTTFLNIRIFNRGGLSYSNFKTAFYIDSDIGYYGDDYVGCDSSKNLIYTYNADNIDEGVSGYGSNPPCLGVVSLTNPMNISGYYTSASQYPHTDPNTPAEFWNYMNGNWANGYEWFYGGMGYAGSAGVTTLPTNYLFSGNPYTGVGWTEITNGNPSGDRRNFMVLDSVSLIPGQESCFDLAILYSRVGTNLENVQGVIDLADSVQLFFDTQSEYNCNQVVAGIEENNISEINVFPNPNNGKFTLVPYKNWSDYSIDITDLSGRLIRSEKYTSNTIVQFELKDEKGIFLLTITSNGQKYSSRIIVAD